MTTNQEDRQTSVRGSTGTTGTLNEDWLQLFADAGITTGTFNEQFMQWIQTRLTSTTDNFPELQQEFADDEGVLNYGAIGTFTP